MSIQDVLLFCAICLALGVPFAFIWFLVGGNPLWDDQANDVKR